MTAKALVVLAALLLAAALALWVFGSPFGGNSGGPDSVGTDEHAQAIRDANMFLEATSGGHPAYHVVAASQVGSKLWRVKMKESIPRGNPRPARYACLTIQVNRFRLHRHQGRNMTVSGIEPMTSPDCPSGERE